MDFNNIILLTHKACMDGSTCALLFLAAGGKKENIFFSNPTHSEVEDKLMEILNLGGKDVILADISISIEMAEHLEKSGLSSRVEIIDHHNSAIPLSKYLFCRIDENNLSCGSMLLYNRLMALIPNHGNLHRYFNLVYLADDNDRWQHNDPDSLKLAAFHKIVGQELFIERFVRNPDAILTCQETYLVEMYDKKLELDIQSAKRYVKRITKIINNTEYHFGFVVGYGIDQSLLGHAITDDPELDIDVAIVLNNTSLSFRRRDGCSLDVSVLAKNMGGGGHCAAAGCNLSGLFGTDFIDLIVDKMKFE